MEDIFSILKEYVSPVSVYYLAEALGESCKPNENLRFSKEICQALYIPRHEWRDLKEFERDVMFEEFLEIANLLDPLAERFIQECLEEGRVSLSL